MSNKPEDQPDDGEKFGLSLPTGNMPSEDSGVRPEIQHSQKIDQSDRRSDEKYKAMGWKGIDDNEPEEEDDDEPQLSFSNKEPIPEDELDMTLIIDQNNSYYVTTRDSEEREAPSETEMRRMIKDAKDTYSPERILITAHVDATHARLIAVCDAGQSSGLKIEVKTTDLEY